MSFSLLLSCGGGAGGHDAYASRQRKMEVTHHSLSLTSLLSQNVAYVSEATPIPLATTHILLHHTIQDDGSPHTFNTKFKRRQPLYTPVGGVPHHMSRVKLCRGDKRARKVCSPCQTRFINGTEPSVRRPARTYNIPYELWVITCMDCKPALKHTESWAYRKRKL